MNPIIDFQSCMADQMHQFVAFKRMQGYDYTSQARTLSYFDQFLIKESIDEQEPALRLDILQRYVETTAHLEAFSRRTCLSSLREFSRYLHAKYPHSVVLPKDIVPRHPPSRRFCRIELAQVAELMAAAAIVRPPGSLRAHTLRMLVGLLYSTGLRIREALGLTLGDLDAKNSTLHVAQGKFDKQRLVPLSSSTLAAVNHYLSVRSPYAGTANSSPLFIGSYNKALSYTQAYDDFQRLCRQCDFNGPPQPRLHDLRHNYACRRLELWREEGRDVNTMLPVLATAMGHVNIFHTQIYLHIEPSDLHHAATRLLNHIQSHSEDPS